MCSVLIYPGSLAARDTAEHPFPGTHLLWPLFWQRWDSGQDQFGITGLNYLVSPYPLLRLSSLFATRQTDQSLQNAYLILLCLEQCPEGRWASLTSSRHPWTPHIVQSQPRLDCQHSAYIFPPQRLLTTLPPPSPCLVNGSNLHLQLQGSLPWSTN